MMRPIPVLGMGVFSSLVTLTTSREASESNLKTLLRSDCLQETSERVSDKIVWAPQCSRTSLIPEKFSGL